MNYFAIQERYHTRCGAFDISTEIENENRSITYINTNRFTAHTLYSEKLRFEEFSDKIRELYYLLFGNHDVMAMYTNGLPQTEAEFTNRIITQSLRSKHNYPFSAFIIEDNESGDVVGYEIINDGTSDNAGDISYLISKKYHRSAGMKDVGYENVGALIWGYGLELYSQGASINQKYNVAKKCFEDGAEFKKIEPTVDIRNIASIKILENLGFTQVKQVEKFGHQRYEYVLDYTEMDSIGLRGEHNDLNNI